MSDQPPLPPPPPGFAGVYPPPGPRPYVPDYLVWALLETLFCCQPLGIAGLVYASRANGKTTAGDIAGALEDAATARKLLIIGVLLGVGVYVVIIAFYAALMGIAFWAETA